MTRVETCVLSPTGPTLASPKSERRARGVVQVLEAARGALRDAHARGPVERRAPRGQVQQVVLQGAQRHELVDEHAVVGVGAEAQQRHQVGVLEQAEHERLHQELARALHAIAVQLLDGHLRARRRPQAAPVHGAEAALAQQRLRPEPARGLGQLGVREGARRHLARLAHLQDLLGHPPVTVGHCMHHICPLFFEWMDILDWMIIDRSR
jgi:hypothetical protein